MTIHRYEALQEAERLKKVTGREAIGLDRYAKFDLSNFKHSMLHQPRSAYTWVFGAYVYCLKVRDYDSAELLLELLDSKQEQLKALRTKIA